MKNVFLALVFIALIVALAGCDSNASSNSSNREEEITLNLVGAIEIIVPAEGIFSLDVYKGDHKSEYSYWGSTVSDKNFKIGLLPAGSAWEGRIFVSSKAISFDEAKDLLDQEIEKSDGKAILGGLESLLLFPGNSILLDNRPIFAFGQEDNTLQIPGIGWGKGKKSIFTWDRNSGKRSDIYFLLLYPKAK